MPLKDWLHRFQPAPLYIILTLSICYFVVQLVFSHITHALTLLMASYHMLCNIIALAGCIITIKHSKRAQSKDANPTIVMVKPAQTVDDIKIDVEEQNLTPRDPRGDKLRNTFGWTRIDILAMLIVFIFLASLSFSLLVEALQTLVNIDNQDTMHLPIPLLILSSVGLVLNGLCYLLIGGYTMHQGSFLRVTPSGDVVLDRSIGNAASLKAGERQLSKSAEKQDEANSTDDVRPMKRQGFSELFRDISSTLFVIICSTIVYFYDDEDITVYIDPIISIFSCVVLLSMSYPYMKESCLILLQTIPGSIDLEIFEKTLLLKFPEIVNYHDLHIWQLTASKYVSTVHIIFKNPRLYTNTIEEVKKFFHEQGITKVTIQPEFENSKTPSQECLVQCPDSRCAEKVCCQLGKSDLTHVCTAGGKSHVHGEHMNSKSKSTNNLSATTPTSKTDDRLKKSASDWQVAEVASKELKAVQSAPDVDESHIL